MNAQICIERRPDVEKRTGLGRSRLDALEAAGKFPKRIRISDRAVGWRSDQIDEWILNRPLADEAPPDAAGNLPTRGITGSQNKGLTRDQIRARADAKHEAA